MCHEHGFSMDVWALYKLIIIIIVVMGRATLRCPSILHIHSVNFISLYLSEAPKMKREASLTQFPSSPSPSSSLPSQPPRVWEAPQRWRLEDKAGAVAHVAADARSDQYLTMLQGGVQRHWVYINLHALATSSSFSRRACPHPSVASLLPSVSVVSNKELSPQSWGVRFSLRLSTSGHKGLSLLPVSRIDHVMVRIFFFFLTGLGEGFWNSCFCSFTCLLVYLCVGVFCLFFFGWFFFTV